MPYIKTKIPGVYAVTKKDKSISGYSVAYKNEYRKAVREVAMNPEGIGKATTEKQAELFLKRRKIEISELKLALADDEEAERITDKPIDIIATKYFDIKYGGITDKKKRIASYPSVRKEELRYLNHIKDFMIGSKKLSELPSSKIRPEHIQSFQNDLTLKGLTSKTNNNILDLLRAILNYGLKNDHSIKDFMKAYEPLMVDNLIERVFSKDEARAIIESVDDSEIEEWKKPKLKMMFQLLYFTGQRPESVRMLQKSDISNDQIKFKPIKKQKSHYVPITADLREPLMKWIEELDNDDYLISLKTTRAKPMQYSMIRKAAYEVFRPLNKPLWYKKGMSEAQQKKAEKIAYNSKRSKWCSMYSFRHSAASTILEATGNITLAQKVLNHSSSKMSERYAKVSEVAKREATDVL